MIAIAICAIGCWTTVVLLSRARQKDARNRSAWIAVSAAIFSLAVWATHFIAMLAFRSGLPLGYDVSRTALSILIAALFTWLGFSVAVRTRAYAWAGIIIAVGISGMHYMGMSAVEGPIYIKWDLNYVLASILSGSVVAALAFLAREHMPPRFARITKASLLALSVCCVHFIGMTAVTIVPHAISAPIEGEIPAPAIAIAVGSIALLIVGMGLVSAYLDLYLEKRRNSERRRLMAHIAALEANKHELGLALEAAYAANKSKSAFLASMSHELRTPLNAIIGFSELMSSEPFGPLGHNRYKGYSRDISKAGTHLLDIINDILDISRLEAKKAELIESEILLPPLLADAIQMVESHAEEAGVSLALGCPNDLPLLWADSRRVKQILLNLLSNAIKFTPRGGRVVLECQEKSGAIELQVRDTGIGIAKDDLPKAFESFGQIDSRLARSYEGSGLGLPLARHLAELHGGSLTLESEVNTGTIATVRFPAERSLSLTTRVA